MHPPARPPTRLPACHSPCVWHLVAGQLWLLAATSPHTHAWAPLVYMQGKKRQAGSIGRRDERPGRPGVHVEAVARDLSAVGHEERMAALLADAPELLSLLGELQQGLAEVC